MRISIEATMYGYDHSFCDTFPPLILVFVPCTSNIYRTSVRPSYEEGSLLWFFPSCLIFPRLGFFLTQFWVLRAEGDTSVHLNKAQGDNLYFVIFGL